MTRSVTKVAFAAMAFQAVAMCVGQDIQVNMDGQTLAFPDTKPLVMYGDNVMVPARPILEHMGGDVHWDDATQTATTTINGKEVELKINDFVATVDGKYQDLQNAPVIVDGRMMIPMRFLSDAFGAQVNWTEGTQVLSIDTGAPAANNTEPTTTTDQVPITLYQDTVIPIVLDQPLSSTDNQPGDTFTATVNDDGKPENLPSGTKVEGHVVAAYPMSEGQPATLQLAFDRLVLPDGQTVPIEASLDSPMMDYIPADQSGPYDYTLSSGLTMNIRIDHDVTSAL